MNEVRSRKLHEQEQGKERGKGFKGGSSPKNEPTEGQEYTNGRVETRTRGGKPQGGVVIGYIERKKTWGVKSTKGYQTESAKISEWLLLSGGGNVKRISQGKGATTQGGAKIG